jgi:hypothetical protein
MRVPPRFKRGGGVFYIFDPDISVMLFEKNRKWTLREPLKETRETKPLRQHSTTTLAEFIIYHSSFIISTILPTNRVSLRSSCSQIRSTRHPCARSSRLTLRSLARFPLNFLSQNARF